MVNGTERALLEWLNTFPIDPKVESSQELSDGLVLNEILGALNQDYFVPNLEKNTTSSIWLRKKQNLESVYKSLLRFHRDHPNYSAITIDNTPNLSSIAENGDVQETVKVPTSSEAPTNSSVYCQPPRLPHSARSKIPPRHDRTHISSHDSDTVFEQELAPKNTTLTDISLQLLTILLLAAISGENREQHIAALQDLEGAVEIMEVLKKMQSVQQASTNNAPSWEDATLPTTLTDDLELAAEEERAALFAEHTALKKRHADYITRFEKLQDSYEDLKAKNEETEEELRSARASNRGDLTSYVEEMQDELQQKNDLISNQEFQLEDYRKLRDGQEKELAFLRPAAEKVMALQDQVQELRIENGALSKKANMVDNFQRKLESQSNIEKDNARLRDQIDTYRENQKHFDYTMQKNSTLQASVDEYSKRFHNYELELVELSTQKKILEEEIRHRDTEIHKFTEQKRHDEDFIKDLQETIATGQTPNVTGMTLGEELDESNEAINYALENSRLVAENQLLKSDAGGTRNADLRADNLELTHRIESLEQKYNRLMEAHALGQEQLNAMLSKTENEKDEAVLNTRRLYLEANRERETLRHEVAKLNADVTNKDREILAARGDLKALGEDPYSSLQELKATNNLLTSSFESDLVSLRQQIKLLTADNEQQKSHLVEALLDKDKLRKEAAELREAKATTTTTTESQGPGKDTKSALEALKENEKLKLSIQELQRKIKSLEENSTEAQKGLLKNVLRENAMMSTAWYDLSSRLQSNHVVLQRRQDAPKSWLNKQRQMVNATPRR